MRDFKMRDDPEVLPEGFQLDDPFAAEFVPEQLPVTKKQGGKFLADPFEQPVQEEVPLDELYQEPLMDEEIPLEENLYAEIPLEEPIYEQLPSEEPLYEEVPLAEAAYEAPAEYIPAPEITESYPLQEEPAPVLFDDGGEFQQMFESAEPVSEPVEIPENTHAPQKGRPKRRSKVALFGLPHLAAAAIWIFVILAVGVSMGRLIWVCAADVLAFGREEKMVTISITKDDDMDSIAQKLQDAGLIRYADLFKFYADFSHAEQKISTGTYTLNTLYDYHALVGQMSARSSARAIVEDVLIPEGYTCRQIFQRLEDRGICTVAELEEYAANGDLGDYWFLEGIERGHKYCLEGFLFPATYDFYENSTPKQVLTKMLNAFDSYFTDELYAQLEVLNGQLRDIMEANGKSQEYIAANLLDLRDLINIAALIEEESSGSSESPDIASVIYNRLYLWGDTPRYLNIDASIIYALDGKSNLTSEDMAVDSPYNTYTNTGLPAGPISNPGLASIKAALEPASTPYYYYVLDPALGTHIFATTYEEHQNNIAIVSQHVAPTEEVSYG